MSTAKHVPETAHGLDRDAARETLSEVDVSSSAPPQLTSNGHEAQLTPGSEGAADGPPPHPSRQREARRDFG